MPGYRYRLERDVGGLFGGKTVARVMVAPSMVNAEKDDATIRKVKGFARRMGAGRAIVGNLFAFRATDLKTLRENGDEAGPRPRKPER